MDAQRGPALLMTSSSLTITPITPCGRPSGACKRKGTPLKVEASVQIEPVDLSLKKGQISSASNNNNNTIRSVSPAALAVDLSVKRPDSGLSSSGLSSSGLSSNSSSRGASPQEPRVSSSEAAALFSFETMKRFGLNTHDLINLIGESYVFSQEADFTGMSRLICAPTVVMARSPLPETDRRDPYFKGTEIDRKPHFRKMEDREPTENRTQKAVDLENKIWYKNGDFLDKNFCRFS